MKMKNNARRVNLSKKELIEIENKDLEQTKQKKKKTKK